MQELCDRSGTPYLFYTATRGPSPVEAVTAFLTELRDSGLDWPEAIAVGGWWNHAFQPEIDLVGADSRGHQAGGAVLEAAGGRGGL